MWLKLILWVLLFSRHLYSKLHRLAVTSQHASASTRRALRLWLSALQLTAFIPVAPAGAVGFVYRPSHQSLAGSRRLPRHLLSIHVPQNILEKNHTWVLPGRSDFLLDPIWACCRRISIGKADVKTYKDNAEIDCFGILVKGQWWGHRYRKLDTESRFEDQLQRWYDWYHKKGIHSSVRWWEAAVDEQRPVVVILVPLKKETPTTLIWRIRNKVVTVKEEHCVEPFHSCECVPLHSPDGSRHAALAPHEEHTSRSKKIWTCDYFEKKTMCLVSVQNSKNDVITDHSEWRTLWPAAMNESLEAHLSIISQTWINRQGSYGHDQPGKVMEF